MPKTLVEKFVADRASMRLFQQERAIYEVTELLESAMGESKVTRSELAKRLGKSKGWVTQMLDGEANKTIRTVADAFAVLGQEYHATYRPILIGKRHADKRTGVQMQPETASAANLISAKPGLKLLRSPNEITLVRAS
jgi:hypothetical protein